MARFDVYLNPATLITADSKILNGDDEFPRQDARL
jgi:hypothetical protein